MWQKFGRALCADDLLPGAMSSCSSSLLHELLPDPERRAAYLTEARAASAASDRFEAWVEERIESDFNDWRNAIFTAASCRVHGEPTHVGDALFEGLLAETIADGPMPSWADIDQAREIYDADGPEAAASFLRSTIPIEETKPMNTTMTDHDLVILKSAALRDRARRGADFA